MTPLTPAMKIYALKSVMLLITLLGPVLTVSAQTSNWISKGPVPANAVQGGYESGKPVYVCRGRYSGSTHPGKLVGDKCYIGYAGREIALDRYQILVGNGKWKKPEDGYTGVLVAGTENGEPLYLCRGRHAWGMNPGKVVADKCNVGYNGEEKILDKFEVFYSTEGGNLSSDPNWPSRDRNRPDSNPNNRFPNNAISGGEENGQPLFVCRASYMGGTHPGKVVADKCNIGYAGKEVVLDRYEVLTGNGRWGSQRMNFIGAFAAGSESGRTLYLCRGSFAGGVHPGKVVEGKCNIGYAGEEKILTQFEVFYELGVNWVRR
jgi:hypothetical protein